MEKKKQFEISDVLQKTLDELERVEIEWSADEITLRGVTGRMILYAKSGQSGTA